MPISEADAGRSYPSTPPYPVSRTKIVEFADAIGDDNPAYRGPDPVAPPTFVAVVTSRAWEQLFDDPELGLALRRIVHGDQRFTFHRPVRAGDELSANLRIDRVRSRGTTDIISASMEITGSTGEPVCTAAATFFHSHEPAGGAAVGTPTR